MASFASSSPSSILVKLEMIFTLEHNESMTRAISLIALLFLLSFEVTAEDTEPVILGLGKNEADKYNAEFMKYDRRVPLFQKNGIRTALCESGSSDDLNRGGLENDAGVCKTC